jgi:hypothetical protein
LRRGNLDVIDLIETGIASPSARNDGEGPPTKTAKRFFISSLFSLPTIFTLHFAPIVVISRVQIFAVS